MQKKNYAEILRDKIEMQNVTIGRAHRVKPNQN